MAVPRRPRKKKAAPGAAAEPRRPLSADELRGQAEERLDGLSAAVAAASGSPLPEELTAAVHELRVHQIELEMQNKELRRSQLELEEQREKYSDLFDLAPVGYLTLSDEGIVLDANFTAAHLLDVERRQLIEKPFIVFVFASDPDVFFGHLEALEQTGAPQACELRLRRGDAEAGHFWARLESRRRRVPDGERPSSWVTFTDISERKQADEELRRSERSLQSTIDGLSASIAVLDDAGTILLVNQAWRAFAEQNGLAAGSVSAGANYLQVCDAASGEDSAEAAPFAAGIRAVLCGETDAYVLEYPCHAPDKKRWFAGRVTAFPGEGPRSVVVAHEDITARKQAEDALRESEERFRTLVEWTPEAVVVHRGGKLIYVNPAAVTMFGAASAQDLIGKPILELIHPDCHRVVLERVKKGLDDNVAAPLIELRYLKLDGTIIEAEVQGTPIVYDGEPAIHVALRDVTTRKLAEEALRESEERFRTMFAGSRDAMMTLAAPSWRFTAGNPAALEMFGAGDAAEFTALGPWDISPERQPDGSLSADRSLKAIETALREGSHFFEWTHKRLDGAELPCTVLLTRIEMAGQTLLEATVRDVTAQKQAEEALREREAIFRSIVEQAVDAIGLVEVATGRFIEFNDAACSNLGYGRDELASLSLADIDLQWPGEGIVQALAHLQAKGADAFETRHRRKDGAIRDVRVSAAVIEVAGRPCLAAIWSDITASKLAHEELARHRQHLEELVAARTEALGEANRVLAAGAAEVTRSRQNFDTFFNTIDDLLFVLDANGNMIHVNETVCRRLGYSEDELLGRPVLDVISPERRDEAGRIVAAMLAGEADFCPIPVATKGGAEIPVETRVVPGVWNGEPALFAATKDVSALKISEEKFQRLFQSNPTLMAVSSLPERHFIEVNDAFLDALGYSREEVLGHTTEELGLAVDPEQQRAVADQLQARGRVNDCELKVRCKDGTILDGLFSGEIIESQGQPYFLTVMIDQTERRQAEEALRRREEQLASAIEGSGIGLWDWYPQTGEETFSERWAEIAGYSLAELAPTSIETWRDLCHPDDLRRADELLEEHFAGHSGIYECETRMRHKDGHWVWALDQGKVSAWDSDGLPLRMIGTELDITDRKQAAEDLLESLATQQSITEGVIVALARTVEVRDPYTAGHQRRVSELATAMALHMGLGGERAEGVRVGGMLHDVGKITIPAEILSKPGLLSTMEFGLIKGHAQSGFEILAAIHFPWPVAEMALQHHERPNGSGYPAGLAGEEILLEARILAVADVVEAMASHRPYRPALGLEAAFAEVRSGAGVRYDAGAVAACESVFAQGFVFSEA